MAEVQGFVALGLRARGRVRHGLTKEHDMQPGAQPIYLGHGRAIARTRTGEFICVDTNSLEALNYILDFDYEPDIMAVFRRFLTPNSVVLDIGANFGVFTAAARCIAVGRGQIFSFEGNPHTFEFLRRTVYANKLLANPRVHLVNALVGEAPGEASIDYLPDMLGGARIGGSAAWGSKAVTATVPMVSVDSHLPPGLPVDLVKIDVEGYEPHVLKGMLRTIERSPDIRIIMEFMPSMLDEAYGARRFVEDIADLGFCICTIGSRGLLQPVAKGSVPGGPGFNHNVFLTRHADEDCARRHISIPVTTLARPHPAVGESQAPTGSAEVLVYNRAPGTEGSGAIIFHGPYINLRGGRYALRLVGNMLGRAKVRVTHNFGVPIAEGELANAEPLVFDLAGPVDHFEVIAYESSGLEALTLTDIALEPL